MIQAVQEKSGFVPNVFLALAHRPDEFRAFFAIHDALMDKTEGLSKAEREMIVVATARSTTASTASSPTARSCGSGRRTRSSPTRSPSIRARPTSASASATSSTSRCVWSIDSGAITDDDLDDMRDNGFTDDEIWDIGAITAFFAQSNRLANLSSMRPNDEFYAMAR